jgi:hypothetical protein
MKDSESSKDLLQRLSDIAHGMAAASNQSTIREAIEVIRAAHEPATALETIAAQLQHWLDFHASQTSTPSDDATMVQMPVYPTRRTIKAWVSALRSAPPPDVARDAERWRALIGCARVRVMGSAGLSDPQSNFAHIGVEFWTHHAAQSTPEAIETILKFVERATATKETAT